jgi:hypothetical protein
MAGTSPAMTNICESLAGVSSIFGRADATPAAFRVKSLTPKKLDFSGLANCTNKFADRA